MKSCQKIMAASVFAAHAHGEQGQVRKYSGRPYIEHPARVAQLVAEYFPDDPEMIQAAWLHDVVEDTAFTIEQIHEAFGEDVGSLVDGLTDISQPEDGNRKARKKIDRDHTVAQCARVKNIKLCDLIDNTADILSHDLGFAKVYLDEKMFLLNAIKEHDIDRDLFNRAVEQAYNGLRFIEEERLQEKLK